MKRFFWASVIIIFLLSSGDTKKHDEGLYAAASVSPPPVKLSYLSGVISQDPTTSPDYIEHSSLSHKSGKHYFEIVIDETKVGQITSNVIARISDGVHWNGAGHKIETQDLIFHFSPTDSARIIGGDMGNLRIPKVIIGIAVDLDAGYLYLHRDGKWLDDAFPDSGRGLKIENSGDVKAEVTSTASLQSLFNNGAVKINFGGDRFTGFLPPGYRGFDWPSYRTEKSTQSSIAENFPKDIKNDGATTLQLIQHYAEWIQAFSDADSPATDPTGQRCDAGQSGSTWFLAGTRGLGKVKRECVIPEGKSLLVPIIYIVAQTLDNASCDQIQDGIRKFTANARDLRFSLDQKAWENLESHHLASGCFFLQDGSSGRDEKAATSGYWIFLPPLPKGLHVIEFGGRFGVKGTEQDVTYELLVQ